MVGITLQAEVSWSPYSPTGTWGDQRTFVCRVDGNQIRELFLGILYNNSSSMGLYGNFTLV